MRTSKRVRGGRRVSVDGGDGADTITFGNLAQNLTIDLGADDADVDTLRFLGGVNDATIANWEQGLDLVDVVNEGAWSIIGDDGAETTLSDGASTITFLNITGRPMSATF